ncbi:MAG: hypothetical protein H6766_01825 [Candidatus Peribacteria bacterium]|nr:MAG: hypothetical protein H6766_01825 [Candidatus Peribacteria bacterium]
MSPPVKPYLPAGRGEDPLSGREFWIMDNHNYALYARYVEAMKRKSDKAANKRFNDSTFRHFDAPTVLHIDAHADLDQPLQDLSPLLKGDPTQWEGDMQEKMRTYTTECTTVGSFIQPALESGLISDCIQIRSYYTLENLISSLSSTESSSSFILDIDLDFRAHEVFIPDHHLTIIQKIISSLASTSSLSSLTIATSPYFLDQHKAMKFLQQLKPVLQ